MLGFSSDMARKSWMKSNVFVKPNRVRGTVDPFLDCIVAWPSLTCLQAPRPIFHVSSSRCGAQLVCTSVQNQTSWSLQNSSKHYYNAKQSTTFWLIVPASPHSTMLIAVISADCGEDADGSVNRTVSRLWFFILSLLFVCRFHICIQIRGAFHRQSYIILNLSPNFIASCCDISAQLDRGIVHFPLMSR